jgi:hypothetical protein
MLGNNTYKEFARWREHWMSIMSPRSMNVRLSTLNRDNRNPFALKEVRFRQSPNEATRNESSQDPSLSSCPVVNGASSDLKQNELDANIWED